MKYQADFKRRIDHFRLNPYGFLMESQWRLSLKPSREYVNRGNMINHFQLLVTLFSVHQQPILGRSNRPSVLSITCVLGSSFAAFNDVRSLCWLNEWTSSKPPNTYNSISNSIFKYLENNSSFPNSFSQIAVQKLYIDLSVPVTRLLFIIINY